MQTTVNLFNRLNVYMEESIMKNFNQEGFPIHIASGHTEMGHFYLVMSKLGPTLRQLLSIS